MNRFKANIIDTELGYNIIVFGRVESNIIIIDRIHMEELELLGEDLSMSQYEKYKNIINDKIISQDLSYY